MAEEQGQINVCKCCRREFNFVVPGNLCADCRRAIMGLPLIRKVDRTTPAGARQMFEKSPLCAAEEARK